MITHGRRPSAFLTGAARAARRRAGCSHLAKDPAGRPSPYGPTIAVYRNLGADAERATELDCALAELGEKNLAATGTATMGWEYLLMTAVKV